LLILVFRLIGAVLCLYVQHALALHYIALYASGQSLMLWVTLFLFVGGHVVGVITCVITGFGLTFGIKNPYLRALVFGILFGYLFSLLYVLFLMIIASMK
jgi:hypothetical protein